MPACFLDVAGLVLDPQNGQVLSKDLKGLPQSRQRADSRFAI